MTRFTQGLIALSVLAVSFSAGAAIAAEGDAARGKKVHGGRTNVLRSVNGSVQATQVVGDEDHDVWLFSSCQKNCRQKE